ncbi:hypothetical protein OIV83_000860 [Microbotryomycetes sp. JL201]|nr:hypothetical protein OIV83_000860 [Microbotryomycetes sp. JL201]
MGDHDVSFYDNFISKVKDAPQWSQESEQVLVEPYTYLASVPGKEVRSALMAAFNEWMHVPDSDLGLVKNVVGMLHTASLLVDDVEDDSHLRRGMPGTLRSHTHGIKNIYGVPQTINSANYVYFLAYQELQRIKWRPGIRIEEMVTVCQGKHKEADMLRCKEEMLNLHRGQGMDLFWRENLICPTEPEYIDMVNNKTGGLFRIAIKLMMAASTEDPPRQIRDDYVNLQSAEVGSMTDDRDMDLLSMPRQYANNKGFCEDFSEGKFSFPIVHAIRADTSNRQILSKLTSLPWRSFATFADFQNRGASRSDILRERPSSPSPKSYAVSYMAQRTKSFEYTRRVLESLMRQARAEVARLGGNIGVERILDKLEIQDGVEPRLEKEGNKEVKPLGGVDG